MNEEELIDKLADIFHDAWVHWSKTTAQAEMISSKRYLRWRRRWVPYDELPNDMKEENRKWARSALKILKDLSITIPDQESTQP